MEAKIFFFICIYVFVLPVNNKKFSKPPGKCPSSKGSLERNLSLILVSEYNKTVSAYELHGKFDKSLSTVKGMLLHSAVLEGKSNEVRTLLSLESNPNINNINGVTPLYYALEQGRPNVAGLLVICGADPNFSVSSISLLHLAVLRGDDNVVDGLIQLGSSVDPVDIGGKTPLYYAIELNRTTIIPILVSGGGDVNMKGENGKSLLHIAVYESKIYIIKKLIELGAKVDVMDQKGRTPLYIAISRNNSEIESFFITQGANINFVSINGRTILHSAVSESNFNSVDRIMYLKGNVSIADNLGITPLHLCIKNNNINMLKHFIKNNISLDKITTTKNHLIHYAVENGTKASVEVLWQISSMKTVKNEKGLTPFILSIFLNKSEITNLMLGNETIAASRVNYNVDRNGNKPLHLAVLEGDVSIVTKLLDYGANPNSTNKKGKTPLYLAVESNSVDMIRALASNNGDLRYKNLERGDTLLHVAVQSKAYNAVKELLNRGINVDDANNRGLTPLFKAIFLSDTEMIKLLVANGANINMTLANGDRPILTAITNSTLRTIITLLDLKAQIEPKNGLSSIERAVKVDRPDVIKILVSRGVPLLPRRKSLLHLATQHESLKAIRTLLRLGFPVDYKQQNKTPLWTATSRNKLSSMEVLLQNGADINSKTHHPYSEQGVNSVSPSWTLIHEAVFLNLPNAISLLLDYGMDVNAKEYRGWTPLHYAVVSDKLPLVQLLVERGADVTSPTNIGITPLDMVKHSKDARKASIKTVLNSEVEKIQNGNTTPTASEKSTT